MICVKSKKRIALRPEDELLVLVASVGSDPEMTERINALVEKRLKWDVLIESASHHGLLPLLYWHIKSNCRAAVPEAILGQLQIAFHETSKTNLLLTGELLEILNRLESHGILAIPFKGPTLAVKAYGNLAFRQFGDLDILLDAENLPRAKSLLSTMGYQAQYLLAPAQEEAYLVSLRQWPIVKGKSRICVELHSRLTPKDFAFPLEWVNVSRRLQPVQLCGREVLTLSPEDLLLLLCAHGAKHLWLNLGWICDIAHLLSAEKNLDWVKILEQARAMGCERMLLLGLFLASDLLGAKVPDEILKSIQKTQVVETLATRVYTWLFSDLGKPADGFKAAWFHLRVRERLREGFRYSFSIAIAPTLADWTNYSLPSRFSFLYYPLRAARLANKYGLGLLRG